MQARNHIQLHEGPAHDTVVMGAALMGIGSLCLLHSFGLFPIETILRYWPVALIVAGLMNILES